MSEYKSETSRTYNLQQFGCRCFAENNLGIIREESGVRDLINAMSTHMDTASVIDSACTALWGLSLEGTNNLFPQFNPFVVIVVVKQDRINKTLYTDVLALCSIIIITCFYIALFAPRGRPKALHIITPGHWALNHSLNNHSLLKGVNFFITKMLRTY